MVLNNSQKQAVEHSDSPLLIVADPGSGKTRVIIERILHLVDSGVKPSEILCLTFSKKATEEMSQRLENHGIFIIPTGELESWIKTGTKKNKWIIPALTEIDNGNCPSNLDSFSKEVIEYLKS